MYTSTRKLSTHRFHFDLLWSDRRDHTGRTTVQRRERLQGIITPVPGIQIRGYIKNRGKDLGQLAKEKGLEGIIAKRKSSVYRPGRPSFDWLKIKSRRQQEFVACGFTEGKGSRKHFGALLLGGPKRAAALFRQTTFLGWRDDKSPDSLGDADTPTALAGLAFRKLGAQHYFSKV